MVASFGLMRIMRSLLFGVGAGDPVTFISVALLLLGASAAASWVAARRVVRLDPVKALRV
jgi:putative ABC transport system permease protein